MIFVDAARGATPGEIRCRRVEGRKTDSDLTHRLEPSTVLDFALRLYGTCAPPLEVTVCGEDFDLREGLSPAVEAAVPRAVALVEWAASRFTFFRFARSTTYHREHIVVTER